MHRLTLPDSHIDPSAQKAMADYHAAVVQEVILATKTHKVVVVGMKQNPVVSKARKALVEAKISFHYLEYGSYFSKWKPRLAIKLWSGWPTYPQVFIEGRLIGGHQELELYLSKK